MRDFRTISEAISCYKEEPDFNEFTVTRKDGRKIYYYIILTSSENVYARRLY